MPCGVIFDFFFRDKKCNTDQQPSGGLPGGIGRQVKSSLSCSISQKFIHMDNLTQKHKTGNTPTGPKKSQIEISSWEMLFFTLMRVAFKFRALRARFEKCSFQNHLQRCVGCASLIRFVIQTSKAQTSHFFISTCVSF